MSQVFEQCRNLFFFFMQKHATYSKQAILRWFVLMKNLLRIHGFIDIGLQRYKISNLFKFWPKIIIFLKKIVTEMKNLTIFTPSRHVNWYILLWIIDIKAFNVRSSPQNLILYVHLINQIQINSTSLSWVSPRYDG